MSELQRSYSKPAIGVKLAYEVFRSKWSSWDDLFREAAEFATKVGPENVVNISHSADHGDGVVTVWYWAKE